MGVLNFYVDVVSEPAEWSCAHTPVLFEATPKSESIFISGELDGKMGFAYINSPALPLEVGQLVYLDASQYLGFHTIVSINFITGTIYTDTDYDGIITVPTNWSYCPTLEFNIYKGYRTGEGNAALRTNLPFTLIGSFYVEINTVTISYRWDVSGFLKSIFTIVAPSAGISYDLFNRYRLELVSMEDVLEFYQVGNCAIDNPEFNDDYADTGAWLTQGEEIVFDCGTTLKSQVNGGVIMTVEIEDGQDNTGKDFSTTDFLAGAAKDFKNVPNAST